MSSRREFITLLGGAAAAWPRAARAQQPDGMRRVGVLMGYAEADPEAKLRADILLQGLAELGWIEGRNVHILFRYAPAATELGRSYAKELVEARADVIVAQTTPIALAVQRETRTIPIVFVNVVDPVGSGLVASLARPGGNITGFTHFEPSFVGKWLTMIREIAPGVRRVAMIFSPKTLPPYKVYTRLAETAAPSFGIKPIEMPVLDASEIERAFHDFAAEENGGLIVLPDLTTTIHRDLIVALANKHRLAAVYPFSVFVKAGGLMSYGADNNDQYRRPVAYIDRILKGAKPAELPVQAPVKFETGINLKTAKELGLTVPATLLVQADVVIE
jgi:putative tryptophan/tyrosine transport system substrate-binding protein